MKSQHLGDQTEIVDKLSCYFVVEHEEVAAVSGENCAPVDISVSSYEEDIVLKTTPNYGLFRERSY